MKKIMVLLVAVISLVLTACGGSESSGDYKELIEMLDNGEYEAAKVYIDGLAQNAKDDVNKAEEDTEENSMLSNCYGEWSIQYAGNSEDVNTIVIDENGTCTLDGESYVWELSGENDDSLYFTVKEGEKEVYNFSVYVNEYEDYTLNCYDSATGESCAYIQYGHYDLVTVTADNIYDYFEFKEVYSFTEDAFGDAEGLVRSYSLVLKDEYKQKLYTVKEHVAIEASFMLVSVSANVDFENETYEIGDDFEAQGDGSRSTEQFEGWMVEGSYRISLGGGSYAEYDGRIVNMSRDVQIERAIGTLVFRK